MFRDPRKWPDHAPHFSHLDALRNHYLRSIPREKLEEIISEEKTVFTVRRESSLAEMNRQFLWRLVTVLEPLLAETKAAYPIQP
jgi:hypothetical protein